MDGRLTHLPPVKDNGGMRFRALETLTALFVLFWLWVAWPAFAHPASAKPAHSRPNSTAVRKASPSTALGGASRSSVAAKSRKSRRAERRGPWRTPTYADSTAGDIPDGDDPLVRRIAVEALGPYNGSVVVVEAATGRILTMVNQRVALAGAFTPCSTIKIPVALAALSEGLIDRSTRLRAAGRPLDMTEALAYSDNPYFASLGRKLGFERFTYYARLFGLGEKAGLNIEGERPGVLPEAPPANGGIGMMCSFGEGVTLTPLQLAAMMSALANGGTLYYLQYPRTEEERENFIPRVKRQLDIAPWVAEIKHGLLGAVVFGTARRAGFDPSTPIFGKTGTCTDRNTPTHLGWFGAFNESERNPIAVAVLLTGGAPVNGPVASGIAGEIFRRLAEAGFFEQDRRLSPVALIHKEAW